MRKEILICDICKEEVGSLVEVEIDLKIKIGIDPVTLTRDDYNKGIGIDGNVIKKVNGEICYNCCDRISLLKRRRY